MIEPPVRSNLVAQVVTILGAEITSGRLQGELPGENPLCETLRVSRTTLRAALEILQRQGYLKAQQGKPRTISKVRRRSPIVRAKRGVSLIAGSSISMQTRHTAEVLSQVIISLQKSGYECNYFSDRKFASGSPKNLLGRICGEAPNNIWILISCSARTQAWFYEGGYSAFALGHLHPGIQLPAFDVDWYSVGHHAASQLLSKGHRRIGVLIPEPFSAGDQSAETGFAETVAKAGVGSEGLSSIRVSGQRAEIVRMVDALLRQKHLPTALFILHEETALCVYSCLIRKGLRVPEDISILVGDGGRLLERFVPDFAQYKTDLNMEVKRTCNIVGHFASQGALRATTHLLMPDFHRGETIGTPRAEV